MMKLFGDFEAVKFKEENMIFITHNEYIYYIYNTKTNYWCKYKNAGNDSITVNNYKDVSKAELIDAMGGKLPQKETDFMRLCHPSQLRIADMLELLEEDYPEYLSEIAIYQKIQRFLVDSNIRYKSYQALRKLFDKTKATNLDKTEVETKIMDLSFAIIGRDIYKREIKIVDGHDGSSYFWIMPVRVIDDEDTNDIDNVAEMRSAEISIEEDDVYEYLKPFLYKYFDEELEANKLRPYTEGFDWNLTHNFFTYESIQHILDDIRDTVDTLATGKENEYTVKLKSNMATKDSTELELIIDFYRRFLYRMEYMLKVGNEKGYNLISFMGP